jgi:hypothetical protein
VEGVYHAGMQLCVRSCLDYATSVVAASDYWRQQCAAVGATCYTRFVSMTPCLFELLVSLLWLLRLIGLHGAVRFRFLYGIFVPLAV